MSFANGVGAFAKSSFRARALGAVALSGLALAGCAQQQIRTSRNHGHEYFSSAKYGPASPKMVADGEPVPRGGGQYLVGRPYTIAGKTYYPGENEGYSAVGMASWYGDAFHGRRTANGEVYDMRALSAAHPTMPLPSYARVTNLANGYSVIVRVNDRGPYHGNRVMDVSSRVADVLDFKGAGTARIKVDYVGRAPLEGSDDDQLLASLRTDGGPATIDGAPTPSSVMVASQDAPPPSPLLRLIEPTIHSASTAPAPTHAVAASEPDFNPPRLAHPPIPPTRPFDLGSISNSGERVAASIPRPPVRLSQNDRALYFAPAPQHISDPFARLLKHSQAHRLADND
jgi:rare lipoprotein A